MKEAVPGQDAVKTVAERQLSHVHDDPVLIGEAIFAHVNERRGRIDTSHVEAVFDEILGNRPARAASKVENGSSSGQNSDEPVEPVFFEKVSPAYLVPIVGMPLVQADYSVSVGIHCKTLPCCGESGNDWLPGGGAIALLIT